MKITILSLLFLVGMFSNNSFAQKGAYAIVNLGYNFSLGSQNIGTNTTNKTSNFHSGNTAESVSGSFGKGTSFGFALGYMFSDNIGIELSVTQLIGSTYELTQESTYSISQNSFYTMITTRLSGNMLQFNPSVVVSTGKPEGLSPYAKFGIVIGLGTLVLQGESQTTGNTITSSNETIEAIYDGGLAIGFSSAIGTNYSFNKNISLFGELNMINISYSATKRKTTKYVVDGVDTIDDLTIYQKESEFVNDVETNSTDIQDDSKPRQYLKTPYSFGSLGVKIGLRYAF